MFLRDGYAGTTIEAVAAEAGVSKQTIYNHLVDKQNLFLAVMEHALETSNDEVLRSIEMLPEQPEDLDAELTRLGWRLATHFLDTDARAVRRLMFAEVLDRPELIDVWRRWGPNVIVAALSDRLARLARAGHLRITDPDRAARQIYSLIVFDQVLRSDLGTSGPTQADMADTIDAAVALFLCSYAPR